MLFAALMIGCGSDGPERVVVTGEVTYQGKPLEKGQIRFEPAPGNKAPPSGGFILDGRYTIDAKGGVPLGPHKVTIEAYRAAAGHAADDSAEQTAETAPPRQQYIPAKYNTNSELEITIEPGSGTITKDFKLTE